MSNKFFFFACAVNLFYYVANLLASPIIGGYEDTSDTYKCHVSLQHRYPNLNKHFCGGAIIRDRFVLTAAHCFMIKANGRVKAVVQPRRGNVVVLAGTIQTYGTGIIKDVSKVFIPLAHNQGQEKYGDIAVVELVDDLNVEHHGDRLEILQLDPGRDFADYENKRAFVPGNGCDAVHTGDDGVSRPERNRLAEKRQILMVHMVKRGDCPNFDHSICTINPERSQIRSCAKGDSGSPLIYGNTIIGVFAQSATVFPDKFCGMVFTRVSIFMDFITNAINGNTSDMHILDK